MDRSATLGIGRESTGSSAEEPRKVEKPLLVEVADP